MPYLCSLTVDCSDLPGGAGRGNAYEQLKNALVQLGWHWLDTSSFFVQSDSVAAVYGALELVAKSEASIGGYSHVSYQAQWYTDVPRIPSTAANHPNALQRVRALPLPQ
ncbi:MAG: hypothetical protein HZA51_14785 [Planctomycetes bacterium]|nr:hypothetical protein [Planctomycetota bacterium]